MTFDTLSVFPLLFFYSSNSRRCPPGFSRPPRNGEFSSYLLDVTYPFFHQRKIFWARSSFCLEQSTKSCPFSSTLSPKLCVVIPRIFCKAYKSSMPSLVFCPPPSFRAENMIEVEHPNYFYSCGNDTCEA